MASEQATTPKKKKSKIAFTVLVILILFTVLGYSLVKFAEKRVKDNLLDALTPVQQACESPTGCLPIPHGWVVRDCPNTAHYKQDLLAATGCASPPESSAYRSLIYRATSDEFIARWRYVVDVELVVRGGTRRRMSVQEVAVQ